MKDLEHFLREEGVSEALLEEAASFRLQHEAGGDDCRRVPDPPYRYYGKEVWEKAIAATLCGENLLLAGPKATGKNVRRWCSGPDRYTAAHSGAASACWTRSTWRAMRRLPFFTRHSTSGV